MSERSEAFVSTSTLRSYAALSLEKSSRVLFILLAYEIEKKNTLVAKKKVEKVKESLKGREEL